MAERQAILAGGCFWCTEAVFAGLDGVSRVESGYIGGHVDNPTYKQVCGGATGHAEAIRVTYDDDVISYDDLLDVFFATHDPTQLNRQGNDVGTQYRSAIFPADEAEAEAARRGIERAQPDWPAPIVTTHRAARPLVAGRGLSSGLLVGRRPAQSLLPRRHPAQARQAAQGFRRAAEDRRRLIHFRHPGLDPGSIFLLDHRRRGGCRIKFGMTSRVAKARTDRRARSGRAGARRPAADI